MDQESPPEEVFSANIGPKEEQETQKRLAYMTLLMFYVFLLMPCNN